MKGKDTSMNGFDPKKLSESAKEMIDQMNKATSYLKERMHGVAHSEDFEKIISKNDIEDKINSLNFELKTLREKVKSL